MNSLYKPLNEHEVMQARFNLLPEGEYDGVVVNAMERTSTTGNVMADMQVKIFDKDGNSHDLRDFLVFTNKMLWKIKHFCDSAGLQKMYEEGLFTPDNANNQHIRALVGIKLGEMIPHDKLGTRPAGTCYPDKNIIIDYVVAPMPMTPALNDFINDPIPF
jgi:hypothetical protein